MTTIQSIISSVMSVALFASTAQALGNQSYYGYHPASPMALGKGFSPSEPMEEKKVCLDFATKSQNRESADTTKVSMHFVQNTEALKRSLGIDTRVDATVLKFTGSSSYSISSNYTLNEENLNIVVKGETEYAQLALDLGKTKLLPQFQKLIHEGKMQEFERECGSRLVTSERLGVSVSLVISIQNVSRQTMVNLGLTNSGSGGIGPLSGKAQSAINAMLNSGNESHHASMQLLIRGGDGVRTTEDLISALLERGKSLSQIASGIKKILASLDYQHSAPLGYFTTPFGFGLDMNHENLITDEKEAALSQISAQYRVISGDKQYIDDLLRRYGNGEMPEALWSVPVAILEAAPEDMKIMRSYLLELAKVHQRCLRDSSEDLHECVMPELPFAPNYEAMVYALRFRFRIAEER